jgi:hypothetical protein
MTTCSVCYPTACPGCRCGTAEGERRMADAFAVLAANREAVIRQAQHALLTTLIETGSATADDVKELVELPPGINAKCFGAAPGPLARAKSICADGYAKTCRPEAHARLVTVWRLANPEAAERWLREHPEPLTAAHADQGGDAQRCLFPLDPANEAGATVAAAAPV